MATWYPFQRKIIWPSLIILLLLIALVTLISPPDKTLGDTVRLVYVHGSIIRVVLALFALAGLTGLVYLINGQAVWAARSIVLERASLILWFAYLLISIVTTLQAWNGIPLFEPRWIFTIQISVLAPLAYFAGVVMKNSKVSAALNIVVIVAIVLLELRAELIMHPVDPIGSSGDVAIQGAYWVLVLLWALVGVQLVRGLWGRSQISAQ